MKKIALLSATVMLLASCRDQAPYDATGIFEATTVTVSAETAGRLVSFDIDEGDSLMAGQAVGLVDTTLLALQQKQLLSQQLATEKSSPDIAAQAAALRSQIAHQQNECERIARLLSGGAATQKQSDDANAQLRTRCADNWKACSPPWTRAAVPSQKAPPPCNTSGSRLRNRYAKAASPHH